MPVARAFVLVGSLALFATAVVGISLRPGEPPSTAAAAGVLPAGWPSTLQIGAMDSPVAPPR